MRAHGGAAALRMMREARPALVLLLMMPDVDGRDVCRALKMDPKLRDIPVVLFSADDEHDVHWRKAGADAFLPKPFHVRELSEFVRQLLAGGT